jgi:hypothetical protein
MRHTSRGVRGVTIDVTNSNAGWGEDFPLADRLALENNSTRDCRERTVSEKDLTMKKRELRTAAKRRRKLVHHTSPKGQRRRKQAGLR